MPLRGLRPAYVEYSAHTNNKKMTISERLALSYGN